MSEHSGEDHAELARIEHLLDLDRPAEAETRVRRLLATDPESHRARHALARCLTATGRHLAAEDVLRPLVQEHPEEPAYLIALAATLGAQNRIFEGAEVARRAVALAPNSWTCHYDLALVLVDGAPNQVREALAAAEVAARMAPTSADAHVLLGLCHHRLRSHRAAGKAYRRALAIDPGHTRALNNLALLGRGRFRLGRRVRLLRQALAQTPTDALVRANLEASMRLALLLVSALLLIGAGVLATMLVLDASLSARKWTAAGILLGAVGLLWRTWRELPAGLRRSARQLWLQLATRTRVLFAPVTALVAVIVLLAVIPREIAKELTIAAGEFQPVFTLLFGALGLYFWFGNSKTDERR